MTTVQNPLPADVIQALGQQIGVLVTNTIFALWASDDDQAARGNIEIVPVPDSMLTRALPRDKITPVVIKSKNRRLGAQLPDCMIFLLPTPHVQDVCRIVFEMRRDFLDQLSRQPRGIDSQPGGTMPVPSTQESVFDQLTRGKVHA